MYCGRGVHILVMHYVKKVVRGSISATCYVHRSGSVGSNE